MDITHYIRIAKNTDKFRRFALNSGRTLAPITRIGHRYGPEILTGVGIAGGLGTVVVASRATLRLEDVLDATRAEMEETKNAFGRVEIDKDEYHKRLLHIRANGLAAVAKLYAPAATLGVASAGAVLGAHGIMHKRNVALAAAYKAVETSFEQYRKRVAKEYGEEKDKEFRYGFEEHEHKNKETGAKEIQTAVNLNGVTEYARFFDEGSPLYQHNKEHNLVTLRAKQNYANDMLTSRGYLFLNEVYDMLGFDKTQAGQVVGWLLGPDNDNYVDFGIYDLENDKKRQFVNLKERSILLDFNVDGYILNRI